jgi:hypothetical protein
VASAGLLLALGAGQVSAVKGGGTLPYAQVVLELNQTRALLQQANHDYDGFRAKAVGQVTKAIHALVQGRPHKTVHHAHPSQPAVHEPQAKSDAQLRQAMQQLQVVLNQLGTRNGDPQAGAAMTHVQAALADLNQALKIR